MKKQPTKSFFDYSSREKEQMMLKAAKESNDAQKKIMQATSWEGAGQLNPNATVAQKVNDYFGRYHIILNGVVLHEPFMLDGEGRPGERCDTDDRRDIVRFVERLVQVEVRSAELRIFEAVEKEVAGEIDTRTRFQSLAALKKERGL